MSTAFVETDHPRNGVGEFTEKAHTEPEVTLGGSRRGTHFNTIEDRDERIKVMQEELALAVEDLGSDEAWLQYLDTASRFHKYSLNNQILIWIQHPDATRVASFKTWKSLGRAPKKGEKGISIFAPMLVADKDESGNIRRDTNGNAMKKYVRSIPTTVFDISQTEGDDLPESEWQREFTEEPPEGYTDDLAAAITAHGYEVRFEDLSRESHRGYTRNSNGEKLVVIDSSTSPGTQATTLAHELGHIACGHLDEERKGEYHTGHGGRRGAMEMEAESFGYVLSRANGMETHIRGASEYVAGWATKSQEDLKATGDTVAKAVKATLSGSTWKNAGAA